MVAESVFWCCDFGYFQIESPRLLTLFAEFDALTGSKIPSIDIGAPVVCMSYSPTSGHAVIAILEMEASNIPQV